MGDIPRVLDSGFFVFSGVLVFYLYKSSLVVRVELAANKLFGLDGHRAKPGLRPVLRADGQHGQLRLHGVDHIGHGAGEILVSPQVNLSQNC